VLKRGEFDTLEELKRSGLRGLGGAGFNTATKWTLCREATNAQRYVICNADEGEPGTFKDRILLQDYADLVFEGMTVCARVIGADRGFLYLRGEYRYLQHTLEETLMRRRRAGLLGHNILGCEGFDFDIDIHLGAGAYICGEESALIESLEGKRGIPRIRPPFPVTHGYRNMPSVVDNVETLCAAAKIAMHGGQWFSRHGTQESRGSKLLSISGDCARPGIYEYPFGVTIRTILDDCGAQSTQAVQVAGAAGQCIPASEFERRIAFEDIPTGGSFMVFNSQRSVLDMVCNFTQFFAHESCGFCTPCRVGTALLRDLVDKVYRRHGTRADLEQIRNIAEVMQDASHCGLGHTATLTLVESLNKFHEQWDARLQQISFEPAFDLEGSLEEARQLSGRNDSAAHIQ
jgi:[NiFe] hydrogenase diaphorase moiety large subunit